MTDVPEAPTQSVCDLTLYVSGGSDLSLRAIALARELCDVHLRDRSSLVIVDVHDRKLPAGVLATPTLVKSRPLPIRRVVGDLSDFDTVAIALGLEPKPLSAR